MSFKNLSIIVKIVCLLALLGALSIFAAVYSGTKMYGIDGAYSRLLDHDSRAAVLIAQATRDIQEVAKEILENTIAADDDGNAKALAGQKAAMASATKLIAQAAGLVPNDANELNRISGNLTTAYEQTCAETLRLANDQTDKDGNAKAQVLMDQVCAPALADISRVMSALIVKVNGAVDKISDDLTASTNATVVTNYTVQLGGFLLVVLIAIFAALATISRPIKSLTQTVTAMAGGNVSMTIADTDRRDEIGSIANALNSLRDQLQEAEAGRTRQQAMEAEADRGTERRRALSEAFVARMEHHASGFAKASSEVSDAARSLSATAEETTRQAQAVSGAAEEASANVQTVAASTEEMSASIREIGGQVSKSSEIANVAAEEASRTEANVKALSEAAHKIGEVVDLINSIAGQTNLLALNATIEAARAGEAGRGFAVVASEVKQLAAQTARATEEISSKISEIQSATDRTVGSIDKIVGTVTQIQQISTVIAAAIEEQGAATGEISSNTQLAARGTEDVTNNINGVSVAAEMTGSASTELMELSGNLSGQANALQREVADFVKQLRTA